MRTEVHARTSGYMHACDMKYARATVHNILSFLYPFGQSIMKVAKLKVLGLKNAISVDLGVDLKLVFC